MVARTEGSQALQRYKEIEFKLVSPIGDVDAQFKTRTPVHKVIVILDLIPFSRIETGSQLEL